MSLDPKAFARLGAQNDLSPTIFTYKNTSDALTSMDGSGYFNTYADRLKVGDLIYAVGSSNTFGFFVVRSNTRDLTASPPVSGVVDVSNALAAGTINSD